ncbi:MAG TPA: hypothetical protein VIJ27_09960 [Mucilaginibacter sp.]
MEPEFITYQKFSDSALADELGGQLEFHHIEYFIEKEARPFDPTYSFNESSVTQYAVKIKSEDFEKVNRLLKDDASEDVTEIGKDYYLYSFTDDELMEVITKADEWSPFDVVLARKLLAEKGKVFTDDAITAINEKRIEELKVPDPPQTYWIVVGYVCAFAGGLLGIFIGWYLMTYKKTLPNGERVYEYLESDRKQGRIIFYIGIVVLTVAVGYKFAGIFSND